MIRSRIVSLVERADAVAAGTVCLLLAVSYGAAGAAGWSLTSLSTLLATVPAVRWVVDRVEVSVALGAIGCWIALDGLYERVHGDDAAGAGAEMGVLTGRRRRVVETLREVPRPLTAPELRDRTGLDGDELEAALETVAGTGVVDRIGNGYAVEESALGTTAFVSRLVRSAGRRLGRPLGLFSRSGRSADR